MATRCRITYNEVELYSDLTPSEAFDIVQILQMQDAVEGVYDKEYVMHHYLYTKQSLFRRFLNWIDNKAKCGY